MNETYKIMKQLRIQNGMSQETLANLLGYDSRTTVSRIERGLLRITQEMIMKYCEIFEVEPSLLVGGEEHSLTSDELQLLYFYDIMNNTERKDLLRYAEFIAKTSRGKADGIEEL